MASIWCNFEKNGEKLFFRTTRAHSEDGIESITCWLTDCKILYSETLNDRRVVIDRVKQGNAFLHLESGIDQKIFETISTLPMASVSAKDDQIIFSPADRRLQLKYFISDCVPMKFHWSLSQCDENAFHEMFTVPLLRQLVHAEQTVLDLVEIVHKKDLEIEQYKLDGALPLIRKQFVTERFDSGQLKSKRLFDCNIIDLLPIDPAIVVDEAEATVLSVSGGFRESAKNANAVAAGNLSLPNRSAASKFKRNRGYDESYTGPIKLKYADSDEQSDENQDGDTDHIANVSNSTVKSDNDSVSSSSTTITADSSNSNGDALLAKTLTKRPRKKLNL